MSNISATSNISQLSVPLRNDSVIFNKWTWKWGWTSLKVGGFLIALYSMPLFMVTSAACRMPCSPQSNNTEKEKLICFVVIAAWAFNTSITALHIWEKISLHQLAFVSFGPDCTTRARSFLFANIGVCGVFMVISYFNFWVCLLLLCFIGMRVWISYDHSANQSAYFDLICKYSPYADRKKTISASKEYKEIFLRNAVRSELISRTNKCTDVIRVHEPVNLTFIVKGILLMEYEAGEIEKSDEVKVELKRYEEFCNLYRPICADKELDIEKEPAIL